MTFLYRHKTGVYYYRKTTLLPSGKRQETRRSLKTSDYKRAQYLALELYYSETQNKEVLGVIRNQATGEALYAITKPLPPKLTLSEARTQFLAEKARTGYWAEREYRRGETMLEALCKCLGPMAVLSVKRKQGSQFKDWLLTTEKSVTTSNNYLKRAAMLWDWLIDRGDATENPFRGIGIKQRRVIASLRNDWTADQKSVFLCFAKEQQEWRKWILLILRYTGARPSEICQLYVDDIDFKTSTITIQATHSDQALKTVSSARTLPIHSRLLAEGFKAFVENADHPRLFPVLNKVKGSYSHSFVTWFSKARAKDASLPELYGARHTAATEMKNAGIPNQYASAVLGHSNESITYDRYGKSVETSRLRKAIEVIGN